MNYRNLLNEFKVHDGKLVSNQFALLRPRPKATLQKPKALEYPPGVDKAVFRKAALQRAKQLEGRTLASARIRAGVMSRPITREEEDRPAVQERRGKQGRSEEEESEPHRPMQEKVEDESSPRSKPDPTLQKEVREIARNAKVQATHGSMEYPPNSGNGTVLSGEDPKRLPIDRIPRALEALSYLSPDPKRIEDSLQTLLYRSSPDQPLALDEFAVVIHHFEVHRAQQIKAQFNQLDEDGSGAIDKGELRRLLWDTGYSVNRDTLDEIFDEVDKDKSGSVELKEFELVLKIVYDRFGFSRSEVKAEAAGQMLGKGPKRVESGIHWTAFYTLFDRYDADLSGELSADELAGALGWCGHPTSIAEARDIIERYLEKSIQSISRPEFLRIMRCVAEEEIEEFRALFAAMDDDDSGYLDMHELAELFFKLGYTIHSSVIEEAVHGLFPAGAEDGILFEDCVHVLAYIRANEGFSKEEAQELKSVFRKFCSTAGRPTCLGCLGGSAVQTQQGKRLGYPLSSQRRRQLWCRVDLDKSGAIHEACWGGPVSESQAAEAEAATAALSAVRGVAPEDQARYGMDEFRCLSTGSSLPRDAVNDDFCDCDDGSDEPGTGACAGSGATLFYCANAQSDAAYIYTSRVNDGVCDCCNGSDEWRAEQLGRSPCVDTCHAEGRARTRRRSEQISELRSGIKQRAALIGKAKSERAASDKELLALRERLPSLEVAERAAKAQVEAAEAAKAAEEANATEPDADAAPAEAPSAVPGASAESEPAASSEVKEEQVQEDAPAPEAPASPPAAFEAAKPVVSEYSKWMDGAAEVLDEPAVSEPVVSEYSKWMEGGPAVEPTAAPEEVDDSDDADDDMDGGEGGSTGMRALWSKWWTKVSDGWTVATRWASELLGRRLSPAERALEKAKQGHQAAKKELKDAKSRIRTLEDQLKSGVEERELAFSGLHDRCIEKSIGEYKYKICFFTDAKQDHTSIGRWKGWSWDSGLVMALFDNGQYCPGGPERSLTVKFHCGAEELLDVTEPSRCAYEAQMKHPASCTPELLEALESRRVRRPTDEL
ncbi:unnamed protein product [Durusdinium trenchii]|uniref:Glucosidase 2 subunit beta n=1 Tax=Durusdinium trenchii TaxID=1381693 RepID=A0ABP0R056_9DINO